MVPRVMKDTLCFFSSLFSLDRWLLAIYLNLTCELALENVWYIVSLESTLCSLTVLTCELVLENDWYLGII
nr:hypothetical protein Cplu_110 [Cedratvirus plubellavi]